VFDAFVRYRFTKTEGEGSETGESSDTIIRDGVY
jgi:hypothetical protein